MNDDPGEVDVLYAKIHLHDGSDRFDVFVYIYGWPLINYVLCPRGIFNISFSNIRQKHDLKE